MPFLETADFPAVLDACVLLPMPLADTLLRMAEAPRLYLPKWSDHIIEEVSRNLLQKWGKSKEQVKHREMCLRKYFPEAWVEGYESLIKLMTNDEKDRHVLAATVYAKAELIVTYNAKDFPPSALQPWGIKLQGPSKFLQNLYELAPDLVISKLSNQADEVGYSLEKLFLKLRVNAPGFVAFICKEQGINLPN